MYDKDIKKENMTHQNDVRIEVTRYLDDIVVRGDKLLHKRDRCTNGFITNTFCSDSSVRKDPLRDHTVYLSDNAFVEGILYESLVPTHSLFRRNLQCCPCVQIIH